MLSERRPAILGHITDAPDSVDEGRPPVRLDLAAKPADLDVDDVCSAVEMHVPHPIRNERPRDDLARVLQQKLKKGKLFWREADTVPRPFNAPGARIKYQVRETMNIRSARDWPPQ